MDLDALTAARREEWARLDALSRARHLSGAEVDELVTRYRAASADLADIKTSAGRTPQGDYVSTLLARTRLRLTGVREHSGALVPRFFLRQLPAALYRVRWMLLAVAAGFLAVTALVATWIAGDPAAVEDVELAHRNASRRRLDQRQPQLVQYALRPNRVQPAARNAAGVDPSDGRRRLAAQVRGAQPPRARVPGVQVRRRRQQR